MSCFNKLVVFDTSVVLQQKSSNRKCFPQGILSQAAVKYPRWWWRSRAIANLTVATQIGVIASVGEFKSPNLNHFLSRLTFMKQNIFSEVLPHIVQCNTEPRKLDMESYFILNIKHGLKDIDHLLQSNKSLSIWRSYLKYLNLYWLPSVKLFINVPFSVKFKQKKPSNCLHECSHIQHEYINAYFHVSSISNTQNPFRRLKY